MTQHAQNTLVNKFCNLLMRSGNKTKALSLFSQSFNLFLTSKDGAPLSIETKNKKMGLSVTASHRIRGVRHRLMTTKALDLVRIKGKTTLLKLPIAKKVITPENLLETIIENVRPCLEVRKVRIARTIYQVPAQLSKPKGQSLALRWIIESAKKRKQKEKISFVESLAQELNVAYRKQGIPRQRRNELHKLAETNRTFMRLRWW